MNNILKDTIQKGTGRKAFKALDREDLMGKTGTTNDADLWFSGYNADIHRGRCYNEELHLGATKTTKTSTGRRSCCFAKSSKQVRTYLSLCLDLF